jgi:hypothetical protein
MVQFQFDATQVRPLAEYTVLPEGQHLVEITQTQTKQTKAGDGSYLELEYTVIDGDQKGSHHWDRLCLEHPSPKAVNRAYAALSAICHAVGVLNFANTVELHNIPFQITVRHRTDDSGRVSAEVAGYAQRPVVQSQFTAPPTEGQPVQTGSPWGARQQ